MTDFEVSSSSTTPEIKITKPDPSTRVATPDLILLREEAMPVDTMADLIFDDIGGQEIINISRTDLINGTNNSYQLLADIENTSNQYNSNNLIQLPGQAGFYLDNFPISLDNHIPINDLSVSNHMLTKQVTSITDTKITTTKNEYIQIINAKPQIISDAYTGKVIYTTVQDHGLAVSDLVTISDIKPTEYNATNVPVVDVLTKDTFTITKTVTGIYISTASTIYFEPYTGDLIIEVDNMLDDQQVEVNILTSSTIFSDTIYTVGE
jgi:hypothetical protein